MPLTAALYPGAFQTELEMLAHIRHGAASVAGAVSSIIKAAKPNTVCDDDRR